MTPVPEVQGRLVVESGGETIRVEGDAEHLAIDYAGSPLSFVRRLLLLRRAMRSFGPLSAAVPVIVRYRGREVARLVRQNVRFRLMGVIAGVLRPVR